MLTFTHFVVLLSGSNCGVPFYSVYYLGIVSEIFRRDQPFTADKLVGGGASWKFLILTCDSAAVNKKVGRKVISALPHTQGIHLTLVCIDDAITLSRNIL